MRSALAADDPRQEADSGRQHMLGPDNGAQRIKEGGGGRDADR
ncbi:hypothetical protein [Paracoccus mutanolyticus]|nr:hypothetical protein [Paracoccus mutanolyticus]